MHIQIFDKSSNLQEVADQKPPQREDAEDKKVKASFWSPIINSTRKHQTPIIYQRDDHPKKNNDNETNFVRMALSLPFRALKSLHGRVTYDDLEIGLNKQLVDKVRAEEKILNKEKKRRQEEKKEQKKNEKPLHKRLRERFAEEKRVFLIELGNFRTGRFIEDFHRVVRALKGEETEEDKSRSELWARDMKKIDEARRERNRILKAHKDSHFRKKEVTLDLIQSLYRYPSKLTVHWGDELSDDLFLAHRYNILEHSVPFLDYLEDFLFVGQKHKLEQTNYSTQEYIDGFLNSLATSSLYASTQNQISAVCQNVPVYTLVNSYGEMITSKTFEPPEVKEYKAFIRRQWYFPPDLKEDYKLRYERDVMRPSRTRFENFFTSTRLAPITRKVRSKVRREETKARIEKIITDGMWEHDVKARARKLAYDQLGAFDPTVDAGLDADLGFFFFSYSAAQNYLSHLSDEDYYNIGNLGGVSIDCIGLDSAYRIMRQSHPHTDLRFVPEYQEVNNLLSKHLGSSDLVVEDQQQQLRWRRRAIPLFPKKTWIIGKYNEILTPFNSFLQKDEYFKGVPIYIVQSTHAPRNFLFEIYFKMAGQIDTVYGRFVKFIDHNLGFGQNWIMQGSLLNAGRSTRFKTYVFFEKEQATKFIKLLGRRAARHEGARLNTVAKVVRKPRILVYNLEDFFERWEESVLNESVPERKNDLKELFDPQRLIFVPPTNRTKMMDLYDAEAVKPDLTMRQRIFNNKKRWLKSLITGVTENSVIIG